MRALSKGLLNGHGAPATTGSLFQCLTPPHHDNKFFPNFQPHAPQLRCAPFQHVLVLVTRSRARHTSLLSLLKQQ